MLTLLTQETFISSDYLKIAVTQGTMFKATADNEDVEEIPIPESVRESGIIPDGYSVDFVLDPSTIVAALKKQGITTVEQLPAEAVQKVKESINAPENLKIIPTSIHKQKRAAFEAAQSVEE